MSGLAELLKSRGYTVAGSDRQSSAATEHLEKQGILVNIGQISENITNDIDTVVYTVAVKDDNPEMIAAKEKGITIIDRAQLLGKIMAEYEKSVAVAGTHGKTSTTSMISEILLNEETDPTITVGGFLPTIHGNLRIGKSNYFLAEACEYYDSFLKFLPYISVVLNVEADHLDYFKDLAQIQTSFHQFIKQTSPSGYAVVSKDIDNYQELIQDAEASIVSFSVKDSTADWFAKEIHHAEGAGVSFIAVHHGEEIGKIQLQVPGVHSVLNALAALAACQCLGISFQSMQAGLAHYSGVNRRFQAKGSFHGVAVIDDYAHHPTEVKATLSAARHVKKGDVWCVFQPHTYSRLHALLDDFSTAFEDADKVIVADIFAAREQDTGMIHAKDLVKKLQENGKDAIYIGDFPSIKEHLLSHCQAGDMVITMGAGDIVKVGEELILC